MVRETIVAAWAGVGLNSENGPLIQQEVDIPYRPEIDGRLQGQAAPAPTLGNIVGDRQLNGSSPTGESPLLRTHTPVLPLSCCDVPLAA